MTPNDDMEARLKRDPETLLKEISEDLKKLRERTEQGFKEISRQIDGEIAKVRALRSGLPLTRRKH